MDDVEVARQTKRDGEVVMTDMNEGDEEVGLHITNTAEVVIVRTRTDTGEITEKITAKGVEVAPLGVVIIIVRTHTKGEKKTGTRKITVEDAEVALRGIETVMITIDPETDVTKTEVEKATMMTDT